MRTLYGLQYLRGAAAIAVVVFHASARAGHPLLIGEAGVDLFFALSGFLMVAITGAHSRPLAFLADRWRRIAPPYWIATSVFLVGALAGLFPRVKLGMWHIASSYLFIPSVSPSSGRVQPLLIPGWTLNYEMAFYLAFAALLLLMSQRSRMVAMSGLFVALVAAGRLLHPTNAIGATLTDPIMLEFVAGGWVAMAWKREAAWPRWVGPIALATGLALLVIVGLADTDRMRALLFGVPTLLLLVGVLGLERSRPLAARPLPLLFGDASYSIYLWHTLAISLVAKAGERIGLPPLGIFVMALVGGVLAGLAGYRLIEAPILRFVRDRRARPGIAVPAAAPAL
ncbi:acyltransferase [Sphingomonas naphthae]|uniref:Acyltransferase n=1 Tax=Sphingomonas naphthae TaxID=1813468 RepID=A0ABY7TGE5_9SPHN|nr:acyltransferase [Sphingomonas naphthae]WCT71903.1 acyltransferase [Sphingomonas naphthae]